MAAKSDTGRVSHYSRARMRLPTQALIDRPRLLSLLERQGSARLFFVQAPAGYGKTSLLQQWARRCAEQGAIIGWLSLDARDRDSMSFAQHLALAFDEHHRPEPDAANPASVQKYYGWQAIIQQLCDRFIDGGRSCYIFLDDVQRLKDADAMACLEMLISDAPPEVKLVLSTREDAGIALGRLRAQHDLVELRAEDLRFLEAETQSFLASKGLAHLDPGQVRLLQERSEGWIVGIKLLGIALSLEPENQKILESFSGERRQIADFFVEDVFSRQPEDLRDFLMRTSVLDRFCPAMSDAVLAIEGSREMIDRCEAAGLFLQALDQTRGWYRFHHLFAGFLRRQLQDQMPGATAGLYRRAAEWLTGAGLHVEAFDYALKGQDPIYAAEILDAHCESMFAAGFQSTVQAMAEHLPPHILGLYPRLMLIVAWRLIAQWRIAEARSLVAVSQTRLQEMEQATSPLTLLDRLKMLVVHRESQIAHAAYELEKLETLCMQATARDHDLDSNPYLMGSFYNSLQYAQREQYKLSKIDWFDTAARQQVKRTGSQHGELFIAAISGPSYIMMGRTDHAEALLQSALEVAQRIAGRNDPLGAVVAPALAYLHYERNDVSKAEALIDHYMPMATSAGFVDQLLLGWTTKSRLETLRGEIDAALGTLQEAAEFGARHDLDRLRIGANVQQLRLLLRLGRPDDAHRFARSRGLRNHRAASLSRGQFRYTTLDASVALATCRLLAADDQFGDALALARQWRSFVSAAQATHAAVEWDVLVAELLLMSGERLAAQRALTQAIANAAPGRFVRRFLDEGEPIAGLLRQMSQTERQKEECSERFLQLLAADLGLMEEAEQDDEDEDGVAICGKMSGREIEILTLASNGMLNRQIGEKLGLTEGTVKWYLQQVFDKVGIRNRKQAVARARRLGLIR